MAEAKRLSLPRYMLYFSSLRDNPKETFKQICATLGLVSSQSGLEFAQSFSDHWVMATSGPRYGSHERWKNSFYTKEILHIVNSGYFNNVVSQLKLTKPLNNVPLKRKFVGSVSLKAGLVASPTESPVHPVNSHA